MIFEPNRWIRGCLSEMAQFSRSHATFVYFFYVHRVLLTGQAKLNFK